MKLKNIYEYFKKHEEDYYPFEMKYFEVSNVLDIYLNCHSDSIQINERVAEIWQRDWQEKDNQVGVHLYDASNYHVELPEDEEEFIALFIDKIEDGIEEKRKHLDLLLQCIGYYRM